MPTIPELQAEIIEDFSLFPVWDERYAYLIELGQKLSPLPEAYRTDENIIRGCQSTVWLQRDCQDGRVMLQADSDSLIVKGLAALLIKILSGQPAEAILTSELTFFSAIGLDQHLSSQRANGLQSMVNEIKTFAAACAAADS